MPRVLLSVFTTIAIKAPLATRPDHNNPGFTTDKAVNMQHAKSEGLITLAIESSCDDTCVAILEKEQPSQSGEVDTPTRGRARLLFEERITADNRAYGGIHPLTATESHQASLAPLLARAVPFLPGGKPDFVSATRGPGMISSLATGLGMAKGLAVAWQVPFVGVHHMQAHALTPRLVEAMQRETSAAATVTFPYLSFLVSGGHTMLVHSRSLTDHRVLATTNNIAVGEMLDKCARAILPRGFIAAAEAKAGRSLPYGALLEKYAFELEPPGFGGYKYPLLKIDEMNPFVSEFGWRLPAPLGIGAPRKELKFDYSGLNSTVINTAGGDPERGVVGTVGGQPAPPLPESERRLLARATMQVAFEHLASRLLRALEIGAAGNVENGDLPPTCLVVAGGVASNQFLRHILRSALDVRGHGYLPVVAPPPSLCTDNAAMIAWAGMEMYEAGYETDLSVRPVKKWSMDAEAPDGGILGLGGWVKRTVQ